VVVVEPQARQCCASSSSQVVRNVCCWFCSSIAYKDRLVGNLKNRHHYPKMWNSSLIITREITKSGLGILGWRFLSSLLSKTVGKCVPPISENDSSVRCWKPEDIRATAITKPM